MVLSQFMKITISEDTVHGELNINIYYFTKNILENRASRPERKSLFIMKKKADCKARKYLLPPPYEVLEIPGGTPTHELMIKKYNRIKIPPGFYEPTAVGLQSSLHQWYHHQDVDSPPINNSEIIDTV